MTVACTSGTTETAMSFRYEHDVGCRAFNTGCDGDCDCGALSNKPRKKR